MSSEPAPKISSSSGNQFASIPGGGAAANAMNVSVHPNQAAKIENADIDGDTRSVDEEDRIYNKQAAVWVFIEYLHTSTASDFPWDKRGEFFVLINGTRFPSKGKIYMEKHQQWNSPRPRSIYSEFMKNKKAQCDLTIEVREKDPIRDDRLMKFRLQQPFLPGTYRKVINLVDSPVVLSLIIKLEKNVFLTRRELKSQQPLSAGKQTKASSLKKKLSKVIS